MESLTTKSYNIRELPVDQLPVDQHASETAIMNEFAQMEKLEVWEAISPMETIPQDTDVLPCKCIMKQKLDPQGKPIKWKSRLVAGGHRQTERSFTTSSSPTMSISSLLTLCNIIIEEGMQVTTADIVGAYLEAEMKDKVYMKINKELVPDLIKANPKYEKRSETKRRSHHQIE